MIQRQGLAFTKAWHLVAPLQITASSPSWCCRLSSAALAAQQKEARRRQRLAKQPRGQTQATPAKEGGLLQFFTQQRGCAVECTAAKPEPEGRGLQTSTPAQRGTRAGLQSTAGGEAFFKQQQQSEEQQHSLQRQQQPEQQSEEQQQQSEEHHHQQSEQQQQAAKEGSPAKRRKSPTQPPATCSPDFEIVLSPPPTGAIPTPGPTTKSDTVLALEKTLEGRRLRGCSGAGEGGDSTRPTAAAPLPASHVRGRAEGVRQRSGDVRRRILEAGTGTGTPGAGGLGECRSDTGFIDLVTPPERAGGGGCRGTESPIDLTDTG